MTDVRMLVLLLISLNLSVHQCLPLEESQTERASVLDESPLEKAYPWLTHGKNVYETRKQFPGIILDDGEREVKFMEVKSYRESYMKSQTPSKISTSYLNLQHDGDSCCPTHISHHTNTTMVNIYNVTRPIVHFPPAYYQFIPHGSCMYHTESYCDGMCLIELVATSLLTWDYSQNIFVFETFMIPGYCSCKAFRN